jgi:hypothetical protein
VPYNPVLAQDHRAEIIPIEPVQIMLEREYDNQKRSPPPRKWLNVIIIKHEKANTSSVAAKHDLVGVCSEADCRCGSR